MLRPGVPRLSHPGVAHAIPSVAFIPHVERAANPVDQDAHWGSFRNDWFAV